ACGGEIHGENGRNPQERCDRRGVDVGRGVSGALGGNLQGPSVAQRASRRLSWILEAGRGSERRTFTRDESVAASFACPRVWTRGGGFRHVEIHHRGSRRIR